MSAVLSRTHMNMIKLGQCSSAFDLSGITIPQYQSASSMEITENGLRDSNMMAAYATFGPQFLLAYALGSSFVVFLHPKKSA